MRVLRIPTIAVLTLVILMSAQAATPPEVLKAQQELLRSLEIRPDQLKPLMLETDIVKDGQPAAVICHADDPAWLAAAEVVQAAIADATGVTLELRTDAELTPEQADATNVILMGHLDNNALAARLYHNFFICLDVGYTGRNGYVIRTVHNPFGAGHNYILVGGSYAEGTMTGARAFAELVAQNGKAGTLTMDRIVDLHFDRQDRYEAIPGPVSEEAAKSAAESGHRNFFTPGSGRSGASMVVKWGTIYQRTNDPLAGQAYHDLMQALLEYYEKDETINSEGLARYDNDFRDAWTWEIAVLWDLHEESGLFSEAERLQMTNLVLRLALECAAYQHYDTPERIQQWAENDEIVHNHNTFPALGSYFAGRYFKEHYGLPVADGWLTVARGVFNGLRHSPKPLEDSSSYEWLPIIHVMAYSLAEGDTTWFDEGHGREAAKQMMLVMDNSGYEARYGDSGFALSSSCIGGTMAKIAWYYQDPEILWGALHGVSGLNASLGLPFDQPYNVSFAPEGPEWLAGVNYTKLPQMAYDRIHDFLEPMEPNVAWEDAFDKLTLRGGIGEEDEYMLIDGFSRGNHMHWDGNAILWMGKYGQPLLVDGEYIRNAPKYHSSMVIIRDGKSAPTPALAGLGRADDLDTTGYVRTWMNNYNGAEWTRRILWLKDSCFIAFDEVRADEPGDYTLRSCWIPWGEIELEGNRATVTNDGVRMIIDNSEGAPVTTQPLRDFATAPISRLAQQVSVPLQQGETYRFANLIYADKEDKPRDLRLKRIGDGLFVLSGPDGNSVLAVGSGVSKIPTIQTDAELLLISADRFLMAGATNFQLDDYGFSSDVPVTIEVAPQSGKAAFASAEAAQLRITSEPRFRMTVAGNEVIANDAGLVTITVQPGTTHAQMPAMGMPPQLALGLQMVAGAPEVLAIAQNGNGDGETLDMLWAGAGFDAPLMPLPVRGITSVPEPSSKGPADKLTDSMYTSSTNSAGWASGVTPVITLDLGQQQHIRTVVTREWHMAAQWDVAERICEISDDGFVDDIRKIDAEFNYVGDQAWGGNVNTLMQITVDQPARYVRLTISPARKDSNVYLAEIEVQGTERGAAPDITSIATGDINGDGEDEIVAASAGGEIKAYGRDGAELWTFKTGDGAPINQIACADVDGDGRAEVMYAAEIERVGLVSADGEELWHAKPPQFRGITSDCMTVVPADVDGDGLPEVVVGVKSWQYFAYDADGTMLWKNIIYAHSATVGYAADFDGDGKDEVVGGNAYYTLNLIDDNGERLFNAGRLGPEQTAVSSADVDGDGLPEVLCGVDGGEVVCFDGDGTVLWRTSLGDRVTRIVAVDIDGDGKDEICCAAESANIFALNRDGSIIWRTPVPDGAGDLAVWQSPDGPVLVVSAASAGVVLLDADGAPMGAAKLGGQAENVVMAGDLAVVSSTDGTVNVFDLR